MARGASAGARGRARDAIHGRGRPARAQCGPFDADVVMTTMRDLSDTISAQQAELERLREEVERWRRAYERGSKRDIAFSNSEKEVEPLYTALDLTESEAPRTDLPAPYPSTPAIPPTAHRRKLCTPPHSP